MGRRAKTTKQPQTPNKKPTNEQNQNQQSQSQSQSQQIQSQPKKPLKKTKKASKPTQPQPQPRVPTSSTYNSTTLAIQNSILTKLDQYTSLYQQVQALTTSPYASPLADPRQLTHKVRQVCQNQAVKTLTQCVIDAQNQIHDMERGIFVRIGKLEEAYNKVKAELENFRELNDVEIEGVLQVLENKIEVLKAELELLGKVVEKGNVVMQARKSQ